MASAGRWLVVAVAAAVGCAGCSTPGTLGIPSHSVPVTTAGGPSSNWLSYHANDARTGQVAVGVAAGTPRHAWTRDLGAAVRGQALVFGGRILVATEADRVVALRPSDGAVLWSRTVGRPLTDVVQVAGCGNIDPLGITSTPVIDPATGTMYVVAEIADGRGAAHHQLVGLDASTGAIRSSVRADPPLPNGERPVQLLQRASLAFDAGRVMVSYGGNSGDCGTYHGWVVSIDPLHPTRQRSFEVASDGGGGAIWQSGGAPAINGAGDIYVSTGNANPDPPQGGPDPKKYTESVVKLNAELAPVAAYKDREAGGDEDVSTANPVLLPGGMVFGVGKTDVGFLLRSGDLSMVAKIPGVCGSDPDGGPAYDARTQRLFVPCRGGGIQVIEVASAEVGPRLSGADSSPVVLGDVVWALDSHTNTLAGWDRVSLKKVAGVAVGSDVPVFNSPSVYSKVGARAGILLVPTVTGVTAFD
ncbi:PQQ-binding-like beta-propeller repeat protein [Dermatophilaceae bacterium Sec6.4]